jgi:uncharacterized membrane protein
MFDLEAVSASLMESAGVLFSKTFSSLQLASL